MIRLAADVGVPVAVLLVVLAGLGFAFLRDPARPSPFPARLDSLLHRLKRRMKR